ncbi:NAD(P)/FAD-dependent oxidoreductase [Pseudomaricurvus sp.]|uniref:NAD(P)/FAD-dependent oxidoreductase n=1 Tax=Pseudomaricurvus sp. TaxID=2004510 RepID=UPI003F6BEDA0
MKVAIIGAGIAGLTSARELTRHGVQVQVFEKSRGVGGRLANKRLEWGNIDMGAQYFTARDERFQKQVDQWREQGIVACWQFNPHSLRSGELTTRPDSTPRFVGTPKMNSLAHALSQNIDIAFQTRIERLERTKDGWSLVAADGHVIQERYDWVVLSLPAEQSKVLLSGTPVECQIPEQTHVPCWALALATLGDVPAEIQGIFGDEVVSWVSRLSSRPQRHFQDKESRQKGLGNYDDLWMLHFSSEWSTAHAKDSAVNITQAGLEWLSAALEKHVEKPLQVVHDFKHYWRYARVKDDKAASSIIADRSSGVGVIGAWSAGGRVEGAYLSALDFVDYFFHEDN